MSDIFISYSRQDKAFARALKTGFEARGWSVWWDEDIAAGQKFRMAILEALMEATCVVVLWSKHSVRSDYVPDEASRARERGAIVPVLIDDIPIPLGFGTYNTPNLIGWDGDTGTLEFKGLVADISEIIEASSAAALSTEATAAQASPPVRSVPTVLGPVAPTATASFKVGVLHSRTGTLAISEAPVIDATVFALEEINAGGGVLGRQVEAVIEDGGSDEALFRAKAEKLIVEDGVATLFGCWASSSRKAVKAVVEEHDHLLLYPEQYEGLEQSPNVVYLGPAPNQQYLWALQYLIGMKGLRKVFLVGSDYVYPRAAAAVMRDEIERRGAQVVGDEYLPLETFDVGEAVNRIVEAQPDVIFNQIVGETNLAFFKKLRRTGTGAEKIPTISTALTVQELGQLGASLIAGDYSCWSYFMEIESDANRRFVESFQSKHGVTGVISDPMEAAYFGVHLWAQAVEAAGSDDVAAIRQQLLVQSFDAPEGRVEVNADTHHTSRISRLARIQPDGSFRIEFDSVHPVRPEPYPDTRTPEEWDAFLQGLYDGWGERWENPER